MTLAFKLFVIFTLVNTITPQICHSSQWIPGGSNDEIQVFIDKDSIKKLNSCVSSSVAKVIFKDSPVIEIPLQGASTNPQGAQPKQKAILKYSIHTDWHNCCKNASALISVSLFSPEGENLNSHVYTQEEWSAQTPGTVGYATMTAVCDATSSSPAQPRDSHARGKEQLPTPSASPSIDKNNDLGKVSSGTGFLVSEEGHIVTNAHVVYGSTTIKVRGLNGSEYDAFLVKVSRKEDLAIILTNIKGGKTASFRTAPPIALGEPVFAYGFPLSGALSTSGNFTSGNIAALAGLADDTSQIQITTPVQPGNSGGPLLDSRGQIVGIVTSKLNSLKAADIINDIPQNVNFAIKSSVVTNFLAGHEIKYTQENSPQDLSPVEVAEKAKDFTFYIEAKTDLKGSTAPIKREPPRALDNKTDQSISRMISSVVYTTKPSDLNNVKMFFDDNILFYGKFLSKDEVFNQKYKYLSRFEVLNYEILGLEASKTQADEELTIKALIKFYSKRGEKEHRGITETTWTVKLTKGTYVITSENSKLLERF